MQMEAGMLGEPHFDVRVVVGAVVIDDQVDLQARRHRRIDGAQEPEELVVTVPVETLADQLCRSARPAWTCPQRYTDVCSPEFGDPIASGSDSTVR
jgi:hypothetical protein